MLTSWSWSWRSSFFYTEGKLRRESAFIFFVAKVPVKIGNNLQQKYTE